jgi:hypothetical protein
LQRRFPFCGLETLFHSLTRMTVSDSLACALQRRALAQWQQSPRRRSGEHEQRDHTSQQRDRHEKRTNLFKRGFLMGSTRTRLSSRNWAGRVFPGGGIACDNDCHASSMYPPGYL